LPDYYSVGDFMKEMGYTKNEAYAAIAAPTDREEDYVWSRFYMYLELQGKPNQKQEFIKRAEALPSFTN
jgi:hypothetical protein